MLATLVSLSSAPAPPSRTRVSSTLAPTNASAGSPPGSAPIESATGAPRFASQRRAAACVHGAAAGETRTTSDASAASAREKPARKTSALAAAVVDLDARIPLTLTVA
jgi:hypothetical protein